MLGRVVQQRGGRIDVQRCAYHHQYIRCGGNVTRLGEVGYTLTEEHDVRPEQTAVGVTVAVVLLPALDRHRSQFVVIGTQFADLAVQMDYIFCSGALVQVVDVLGDDLRAGYSLLQAGYGFVGGVGSGVEYIAAACVVKVHTQLRISEPRLVRAHVLDAVLLPQSVGVTERTQTALCRYTGTCEYNNLLHGSINLLTALLRRVPKAKRLSQLVRLVTSVEACSIAVAEPAGGFAVTLGTRSATLRARTTVTTLRTLRTVATR